MGDRILTKLEPVRRRQLGLEVIRFAAMGLLAGSLVGIGLGVLRWQRAGTGSRDALGGPGDRCWPARRSGRWSGWLAADPPARRPRPSIAHYDLKDRAVSAVDFVGRSQSTPMHALQVADAEQHLQKLDPRRVVPFRLPKVDAVRHGCRDPGDGPAPLAAARRRPGQAPEPLENVLAAAEEAEESLEDLEEAARKENDPKLKELVQKLTESIEQMKQPGVDVKEALAKLSEMQAAIAAQQAQFNVGLVDTQMQALGEALASTQSLEGAGQSLQHGKYDKAAEQLEEADPKFDRKEVKALKEKLAKAAKQMEEAGLADLSSATTQLAESLEDAGTAQGAFKKLGNLARAQGRRKRINDLLSLQCQNLSECKGNCQKNSAAQIRLRKKSDSPKSSWGMVISGNADGDKTKLDSARKREQVQGQMGEGDVRDRDDPYARRPADRGPGLPRAIPEVSPHDRGRPQFRADPPGPPPDDPQVLRADPAPGRRGREGHA